MQATHITIGQKATAIIVGALLLSPLGAIGANADDVVTDETSSEVTTPPPADTPADTPPAEAPVTTESLLVDSTVTSLIVADTTKPVVVGSVIPSIFNSNNVDFVIQASDDVALTKIVGNIYNASTNVLVKSTQVAVAGTTTGTHTVDFGTVMGGAQLPNGGYYVKYNALDSSGNVATTLRVDFTVDNTAPSLTIKPESVGAPNVFKILSVKLFDAGKIDKVTLNGVLKDLSNNTYSDVNGIKPGTFGAVEGLNTIVVYDVAGNTFTYTFTLDTTGPTATAKDGFIGTIGYYQEVSFKLHDEYSNVVKATLNGVEKPLTPNPWSDLNSIKPGTFGAVEGLNTLVLEDSLGNLSTYTFVIDTTKPVINIPAGNLINGVETFNITQVEANPAKTYVEFDKLVGGVWSKVTGQWFYDTNVFDFTVDTALYGDGKYQIKVSTWDKANNHTSATSARTVDNTGPTVTVKPESVAVTGGYESLSVKLADLNKVDKVTINGVLKDLSNNTYSDVNGIKPGVFGAVEGLNTLVAYDEAGNTTTFTFTLVVVPAVVAPPAGPADPASTGAASSGGGAGALDALPALNVNGDPDVLLPVAGGLLASGLLAFGASVAPKRRNRRTA